MARRSRLTGLWQHADFMRLWTGQTVSHFGSHIGGSALRFTAILVLGATPVQLSLLAAAGMIPILLLGLLAGVWVDRLRRRPLLIGADLGRALLLLSIPLAYMLDLLLIEQLYLVAALVGTLTLFFDVAYQSYLPAVVERRHLVEGNSKLGASDSVAEIAGPPLGGTLVQLISAPLAVLIDALSFGYSAVMIWRIRAVEPAPAPPGAQPHLWHEMAEGLRAVLHQPLLRTLLACGVTSALGGGMIGTLYDLYLLHDLGLSPALVGLTVGAGGVGALLGALLTERIVARIGVGPALIAARLIGAVAGVLLPAAHGSVQLALGMLLLAQFSDIAYAVYAISEVSLRQQLTPDRLLGRVNASFSFLLTAALLVGTLMGGWLGEFVGLRVAIGVGVGCGLLSTLWLLRSPLRTLRQPVPLGGTSALA